MSEFEKFLESDGINLCLALCCFVAKNPLNSLCEEKLEGWEPIHTSPEIKDKLKLLNKLSDIEEVKKNDIWKGLEKLKDIDNNNNQ